MTQRRTTVGTEGSGKNAAGRGGGAAGRRGRLAPASLLAAALIAAAAVGIGGCGGSSSASGVGGSSEVPSSATVAISARVLTLDPDRSLSTPSLEMLNLIGGTLMSVGPNGREPKPSLAESVQVSDGRKTYTFVLRSGLKFSDGSPLTSRDVKATLERSLHDEASVFGPFLSPISAVETPDAKTVVIKLHQPYTYLLSLLSLPILDIFPAAGVGQGSKYFDSVPISAGPYKLDSFTPNKAKFSLNPNFWNAKPEIPNLTVEVLQDPSTRLAQLQSGQIQWAESLPPNVYPQLTGSVHPVVVNQFRAVELYMNNRSGPLSEGNVRKAISAAIDRKQINEVAYLGKSIPMEGFLPPTMSDHIDNIDITPNLDRARSLLKGTSCENGCTLPIIVTAGLTTYEQIATILEQQLAPLGIKANVEIVDTAIAQERELNGDFTMAVNDELSFTDAPDTQYQLGLLSPVINAEFSGYESPEMDQAITEFLSSSGAEREALNRKINDIYAQDLPFLTLVNYAAFAGTNLPEGAMSLGRNTLLYIGTSG